MRDGSASGDVGPLLGLLLTVVLVPWAIGRIPYFKRPDVVARREAKGKLPGWVSFAELVFLVISEAVLISVLYFIEATVHHVLHPHLPFLPSVRPSFSIDLVYWLIQVLAPLTAGLPLGMILANLISWSIPAIRAAENRVIAEGVRGYTWEDLNFGLLKVAAVMFPMSVILAFISLMRL